MAKSSDKTREEARLALMEARLLQQLARIREARERLTVTGEAGKVQGDDVLDSRRLAISESTGYEHPALDYARKAGMASLGDIARALDVSVSFISQVFAGKKPMPKKRGKRFEELTKYPAGRWRS